MDFDRVGRENLAWAVAKGWREPCEMCEGVGTVSEGYSSGPCRGCGGKGTYRERPFGEELMNIVGEVAELNELGRKGTCDTPDDKCPEYTKAEIEAADVLIRLIDTAYFKGWRLEEAVAAKMKFNWTRPHRHGGKRY